MDSLTQGKSREKDLVSSLRGLDVYAVKLQRVINHCFGFMMHPSGPARLVSAVTSFGLFNSSSSSSVFQFSKKTTQYRERFIDELLSSQIYLQGGVTNPCNQGDEKKVRCQMGILRGPITKLPRRQIVSKWGCLPCPQIRQIQVAILRQNVQLGRHGNFIEVRIQKHLSMKNGETHPKTGWPHWSPSISSTAL